MKEIRNLDGTLVAKIDEATGTVEIIRRDCKTEFRLKPDGTVEVINSKRNAA